MYFYIEYKKEDKSNRIELLVFKLGKENKKGSLRYDLII